MWTVIYRLRVCGWPAAFWRQLRQVQTAVACTVALAACPAVHGSSVLLRSSSRLPPALLAAQTYAGKSEVTVTAVQPAAPLTVVLLLDSLSAAQFAGVERDLLTLFTSLHKHPLRVALLHNGALGMAGPFASRARLKAALDDAAADISEPPATLPISMLDTLCSAASELGADWSRALLIGDVGAMDAATAEYASALVSRRFAAQRIQLSWYSLNGANGAWLPALRATGGEVFGGDLHQFSAFLDEPAQFFFQADWAPPVPVAGFVVSLTVLSDAQGQVSLATPDLAASSGAAALPTVERYSAMQAKVAQLAAALKQQTGGANSEADASMREGLQAALEVNPRDPGGLLAAATFYEKTNDFRTAAGFRAALVEVHPQDGPAYAALGHVLLLASDADKAEEALQHAVAITPSTPQMAEDFAKIYLARKNDKSALPYLDEALRADPKRQDLWFLEAQASERVGDSSLAMRSFEHGLALGGVHIGEITSLLRLELGAKQTAKAQDLARRVLASLPADPAARIEFASSLDDLQQARDALAAWKRVLEVQRDYDRAHLRVAQLILESGDANGAEQAANAGLAMAPKSAALYVIKADALAKQHRLYDARAALQQGAENAPEAALLLRFAEREDSFGAPAAGAYGRLAEALTAFPADRQRALERGFAVALRDNDPKQAQSFAALLQSGGHPEFRAFLGADQRAEEGALVPGGLDALEFAAHAEPNIPRARFFAEYCRTLINQSKAAGPASTQYLASIREHFERIAALEAFGKRQGDRVVITLSLNGKEARRNTEKILSLLGIKVHSAKGEVALGRGEKKEQAKKQETVSALALDEVGMQEAFQAGKPFTFEILDERAPLYPSEKFWRDGFYSKDNDPAGFASAALRLPKLPHLYLALSSLNRKSIAELLAAVPLQTLYERYTELLDNFAAALALDGDHAAVPGGPRAEPLWATLAGVAPDHPGAFFRALLERENGKLLAFFFTLSQLDRAHQVFFTANVSRAAEFYKLFAAAQAVRHHASGGYSTLAEVLRSVPLDSANHVNFPGSQEVWVVAKGRGSNDAQTAKMLKKISKAAAPEVEDEVLLRLAQTHYNENATRHTELDNFLAVSRIDAHRVTPLDSEAALLLAQHYSEAFDAYAYFTDLRALQAADFRQFFAVVERFRGLPPLDANLRLGQFHSLIEWICLFQRLGVVDDSLAAKLFRHVCDRFAGADSGAAYAVASLQSARAILSDCKVTAKGGSADQKISTCLLGPDGPAAGRRMSEFQSVLESQKVPSLDALFSIYDAAAKLSNTGTGDVAPIEKAAASLSSVTLPKGMKVDGREKENILRYDPAAIHKIVDELKQKTAKRKSNPKDVEKLARELLAALEPQVTAALAGPVYAFFLRPSDLLVSEDALLLRKHRYFEFTAEGHHERVLAESQFTKESEHAGSYFAGGFAQFALSAGTAAGDGWKTGGHAGEEAIAAEIAAVRSAVWQHLEESDQRLVTLRIEAAREWVIESARNPEVKRALSEETLGLLSLSRRAELLGGIEDRNWNQVWNAVTLPDLFTLGGKYLERFKTDAWASPVTAALRAVSAANNGSRLAVLGAVTYHSFGCSHAHLQPNAPYEEYARHMFPDEIAERSAEFKLYLVLQADALGVPPAALGGIAEALAAKAFRNAQMADFRDWRALLSAYSSISARDLSQALQQ